MLVIRPLTAMLVTRPLTAMLVTQPLTCPFFYRPQVLDESAARQSDPTVLTLQLRQLSKESPGNKVGLGGCRV